MAKKQRNHAIPKLDSEDREREFWAKTASTDYVDWDSARKVVLPELKPSQKTISLRLTAMMLADLRLLANKRDVRTSRFSRSS